MFTGLVESTGGVVALEPRGEQARLELAIPFAAELTLGDSVAVNGCCLTVAELVPDGAVFDVLMQTLRVTSLGDLKPGCRVNLERALCVGDRLGGHFVQGHVDAAGTVLRYEPSGSDHVLEVELPEFVAPLCIDKGSLAVDGISLTIADLEEDFARFWITPHTHEETNLANRKRGDRVNLEADLLAKHLARLVEARGLGTPEIA